MGYHATATVQRARIGRRQVTPHACIVAGKPHLRAFLAETLVELGLVPRQCADATAALAANEPVPADLAVISLSPDATEADDSLKLLAASRFDGKVLIIGRERSPALGAAQQLGSQLGLHMLPSLGAPFRVEELAGRIRPLGGSSTMPHAPIDVAEALANNWLEVCYQPRIDTGSLIAHGAEALCRLRHPLWGVVLPARFIPAYDDPHLRRLSEFVVRRACRDRLYFADWRAVDISVNLPIVSLHDPDFCDFLLGTAPCELGLGTFLLEVNSGDLIRELPFALEIAEMFARHGIHLSIDGVGPEWPVLTGLSAFPFAEIKVDRALTHGCAVEPQKRAACRAIVEFAKRFGARSVAQGIESRADLSAVRTLGFDQVQGFLVAKPMEARKFARSLLKRSIRITANEPAADKAPADELSSNVASASELPGIGLPIDLPAQSDANCATIAHTSAGA